MCGVQIYRVIVYWIYNLNLEIMIVGVEKGTLIKIDSFLKIIDKVYKFKLDNEFRYDVESFMYEYESILENDGVSKDELLEYLNDNYELDNTNKDELIDSIIYDTRLKINELDTRLKIHYENSYDGEILNNISEESLNDIVNLRNYYNGFLIGLQFCIEYLRNSEVNDSKIVLDNLSLLYEKNKNTKEMYNTDLGMEKSIVLYLNLFNLID